MKNWIIIILGFITFPLFAQNTILSSEDARFRAQVARDTNALRNLLAEDLIYIHSNALVETKTDFLNSINKGTFIYQFMQPEEGRTIRTYGKMGISNGVVQVKGILNNNPFDIKLRYTAVYNKQKGAWKLVSWQSTRVP